MDLSSVSLSSERLLLKSFTGHDAREAFEAATPAIARFMAWEPASSFESFAPIWQSWIPEMHAGTDVNFAVRHGPHRRVWLRFSPGICSFDHAKRRNGAFGSCSDLL
jgi:hypothetical protein